MKLTRSHDGNTLANARGWAPRPIARWFTRW